MRVLLLDEQSNSDEHLKLLTSESEAERRLMLKSLTEQKWS
jgi:hypothetical protein